MMMAAKALAIWAVLLLLALLNGVLREAVLIPKLGLTPGFVISGLLLCMFILAVVYLLLPWLGLREPMPLLLLGLAWLILTLGFEFSFGWLRGKTLAQVLDAYTFKGGNLWLLVLLVVLVAPRVAATLRGWN